MVETFLLSKDLRGRIKLFLASKSDYSTQAQLSDARAGIRLLLEALLSL